MTGPHAGADGGARNNARKWMGAFAFFGSIAVGSAAAAVPLAALSSIPDAVFKVAFGANPVPGGLVGDNATKWVGPWLQRAGTFPIQGGAIRGDAATVDRFWPVIETTFSHENADGSFQYLISKDDVATDPFNDAKIDEPTSNAFWLAESGEALLLLRSSSLAPRYASRIDALLPKFSTAIAWLAESDHVADMVRYDRIATNRLMEDAKALLVGEVLAGKNARAHAAGELLLGLGLAAQTAEGCFPEHGGPDTNYNAVSSLKLAEMALFIDDSRTIAALRRGVAWERSRVNDRGEVSDTGNTRTGTGHLTGDNRPYSLNYPDIVRMFAVSGAVLGDAANGAIASRIATYYQNLRSQNR